MKYVRIFLLHFQQVFEQRARSLVWFILAFLNPLIMLTFWLGAFSQKGFSLVAWSLSSITSYYFLLIIAGAFLIVHVEEDVAVLDIREGALARYLLRPISYYWIKFFDETGYRLLQGAFGVIIFFIFSLFFTGFVSLANTLIQILFAVIIVILGYLISFTFKMILGLSAFWFTDFWGLQQLTEVVILVMAGFVMPLDLFPEFIRKIAFFLPFSYMAYFPLIAVQGKLALFELLRVILAQSFWFLTLFFFYQFLWRKGVKKFAAIGQ
ncbi:MAG: ABC-2 family transporter protein [Candidatus Levybacteria bacterium]|nr:ABC-2 family transporter protein [Candidatus Levybacteria bacterium]